MLFHVESDIAVYLGILINQKTDGTIVIWQESFAKWIVSALFLDDPKIKPCRTPATNYLKIDENREKAAGLYNYASIVRMLNCLQWHSCIDISLAVSQVARYVHSPKCSHEIALERIGSYLKGTSDKGLILQPVPLKDQYNINIYVDAAFTSGWGTELGTNPDSVKSQTRYIIEVVGCAVVWCSKLQTCIAISTMDSEYTALSMTLHAVIPLLNICNAINKGLNVFASKLVMFKATVHEDKMGALNLAKLEEGRHTPRSKFYALKLYWFQSWWKRSEIKIVHCDTKDQKADFLTKPIMATIEF